MLHITHMGVNKTLLWARQSIFWPGMTKDITQLISSCSACMKHASRNSSEPLINNIAATKSWQALSIDNFEWLGQKYLIILDYFSRFFIVKNSDKLDSHTTIHPMLEVFMEHRIPNKIRCDHGSNFTSLDFASFCSDLGISLSFSSSYHHQSISTCWM